ncbi:MAG: HpaII family restriction endonuclease [Lachnospiraceae bacterium]|nr:HpaII family restriction endonuclease [Lachnospiraceae bacterium]
MNDDILDEIAQYSKRFLLIRHKFKNKLNMTIIEDTSGISMQIQDIHKSYVRNVGFFIRAEVGNAPILLNAGKTTNFIYKVEGVDKEQLEEINAIDTRNKIKDRMTKIKECGGKITFSRMSNVGFKRNLIMIDSRMPEILAYMLLYSYDEDIKECKTLVELAGKRDPLGYEYSAMYEYKFKKFLCSCALGMKSVKQWDGLDEVNGGYIIVKADGEVFVYHIYNHNVFEQYLIDNTVCERASTTRYEYMNLYEEGGEIYIKMNLQVSFK